MGFDGLVDTVSQVENQQQHLQLEPLSDNGLGFGYFGLFFIDLTTGCSYLVLCWCLDVLTMSLCSCQH
jgi:hypothetical protein